MEDYSTQMVFIRSKLLNFFLLRIIIIYLITTCCDESKVHKIDYAILSPIQYVQLLKLDFLLF